MHHRLKRRIAIPVGAATLMGGLAIAVLGFQASGSTGSSTAKSPTEGWRKQKFTFSLHKPWNKELDQHYRFDSDSKTHRTWVHSTDEPLKKRSKTDPRTEMRWHQEYTKGRHMWDGDVYIREGTDGPSFMQILRVKHPEGTPATDIMMNAYDQNGGTVKSYNGTVIKSGVYNKWWNLKVAHNATTGEIKVYADNKLVLTTKDRGPATRHFKNGVYHHGDGRAEARFRNIRYWVR